MDHAEAHEYIADLALEPERLAGLTSPNSPTDASLREHVAVCARCASELAAWQSVQVGIAAALDQTGPDDVRRIAAPESLRRQVLTATAPHAALGWRRLHLPAMPGRRIAAAALVVVLVAAGAIVITDQAARLNTSDADRQALAGALQTATQVLADPAHRAIALTSSNGTAGGTVAWTRHDLVVLANGLATPPPGQVYRCWVVAPNGAIPVGQMEFVDGEAFWVSALYGWASVDLPGAQSFAVTLEPADSGSAQPGPILLEGSLNG